MSMRNFRKQLKDNNKGSALIVCIIILLFVSILATVILYMSGVNYRMKKNDYQTKKSFYHGEHILESMQGNLVIPVSEALNNAFMTTNTKYASLADYDARREDFYRNTYDELKNILLVHYAHSDAIEDNITEVLPNDSDVEFVKNILHNLSGSDPTNAATTGVPVANIVLNNNDVVAYEATGYASASAFVDKILLADDDYFVSATNPDYYILCYSPLSTGTLDGNYGTADAGNFVELDIWADDAHTTLKPADKCRILIKNICVVCVNDGYTSIISTDIAIQFPPFDWGDGGRLTDPDFDWNVYQLIYYVNWKNN